MSSLFTMGVEEEFQLVDRQTGQLTSCSRALVEKGAPVFGEKIKVEMTQSTLEVISRVCPDILTVRTELSTARRHLIHLLETEGLVPISAGTHPSALWQDQKITESPHYLRVEELLQDAVRSQLIFGLHIHVGIESKELAIPLMNQARTWLPHLLALSSNSPFWAGRLTGMKAYRQVIWNSNPRAGIPTVMPSWHDFERYLQVLVSTGCIAGGGDIWWDVRPHTVFDTIEFRICDMPATIEETVALTALCQALIAKLAWLHKHHRSVPVLSREYIEENKWFVIRYGLDAEIVDFVQERRLSMRDSLHELLDFVDEMVDDLGSRREMNYLRTLIDDPQGTGADRQIAIYQRTNDLQQVIQLLIEQTMCVPAG